MKMKKIECLYLSYPVILVYYCAVYHIMSQPNANNFVIRNAQLRIELQGRRNDVKSEGA